MLVWPRFPSKVQGELKMTTPAPHVLIAEDDVHLRVLLSAILTQAGYKVRTAEDGFSALAEIRIEIPDIILSDLYMPGMSGFELLSVVRRLYPVIQVIAMSSAFSGSEVPIGIAADAFYEKATQVAALLQIVKDTPHFDGLHSAYRPGSSAPVWLDLPSEQPYLVLACPECLRTFTQISGQPRGVIHETGCIHCHSLIRYAIVQPTDSRSSQDIVRKSTSGTPSPFSVPILIDDLQRKGYAA
jgi:CheY-like chemotaxis protein